MRDGKDELQWMLGSGLLRLDIEPPPLHPYTVAPLGWMPAPAVVEGLHLLVIGERAAGPADAPLAAEDRGSDGPAGKVTAGRTSDVSGKGMESSKPFLLSKDMAPVPAKLVAKIHRSEFVDMAELLRDNLEVHRWEDNHEIPTSGESKRSRREIPDLISGVQCLELAWRWWRSSIRRK